MANFELNIKKSPHSLQNKQSCYILDPFTMENRILTDSSPETAYQPSKNKCKDKTTVHYGRRQLLINELEFLTISISSLINEYNNKDSLRSKTIVVFYAGAACGYHLLLLSEFFPFIQFILLDSNKFELKFGNQNLKKNFQLLNQNIDQQLAAELRSKYSDDKYTRLFISDIRRTDKDEDIIEQDMDLQAAIHQILEPYKSYLKFRLPYVENNIRRSKKYLDGDVYFLVWGRSHTSETRLLVHKDSAEKLYDCGKYENQLYHFNHNERTFCYEHDVNASGIDHCYDCRAEVFVFEKYLEIYDSFQVLSLNGDLICKKKPGQYIDYINKQIRADEAAVQFDFTIGAYFFSGNYKFTRARYGYSINSENELVALLDKNLKKKRVAHREDLLINGLERLNLNQT